MFGCVQGIGCICDGAQDSMISIMEDDNGDCVCVCGGFWHYNGILVVYRLSK